MKISTVAHRNVICCSNSDNLDQVARVMWERDIGCLPVIDESGRLCGIVTDRDVCMAAYTQGAPLQAISVRSAMATKVIACTLSDDVQDVERAMSKQQIRRIPVVDDQGRPLAIVSLNDLARAAAAGNIPPAEITSTLAAVAAPRRRTVAAR